MDRAGDRLAEYIRSRGKRSLANCVTEEQSHLAGFAMERALEAAFSLRHDGLGGSGLLERCFKGENWLHVVVAASFDYPHFIQSDVHMINFDTSKFSD
jgi:hypothetical protein